MKVNSPQFGAYLNNRQSVALPDEYPLNSLVNAGSMCEELGYYSVSVGDSPLDRPRWEPITTLAAVARSTQKIKLSTNILQPHLRNPIWLALSWTTLDVLSGGRTYISAAIGHGRPKMLWKERKAMGIPKGRRGELFEESITVLKKLWTEDEVTYKGQCFDLDHVSLGYKPLQRPHPPILIAAGRSYGWQPSQGKNSEPVLTKSEYVGPFDRVARLGDGWLAGGQIRPERFREIWKSIQDMAKSLGRSGDDLIPAVDLHVNTNQDREAAFKDAHSARERYMRGQIERSIISEYVVGTADDNIKKIQALVDAGARLFHLVFEADDQILQMKRFAKDVMPSF